MRLMLDRPTGPDDRLLNKCRHTMTERAPMTQGDGRARARTRATCNRSDNRLPRRPRFDVDQRRDAVWHHDGERCSGGEMLAEDQVRRCLLRPRVIPGHRYTAER